MLFENNPKLNFIFVGSFWVFSLIFYAFLNSIPQIDMSKQGTPTVIMQDLPTVVVSIFGGYLMIFLAVMVYDSILGPKLKKTAKNLCTYGIISFATLAMVFVDLLGIMAMEYGFYNRMFDLINKLPLWQEIFLHAVFPILCLVIILSLRNQKIEYEEKFY